MAYVDMVETLGQDIEAGLLDVEQAVSMLETYAASISFNAERPGLIKDLENWQTIRAWYTEIFATTRTNISLMESGMPPMDLPSRGRRG